MSNLTHETIKWHFTEINKKQNISHTTYLNIANVEIVSAISRVMSVVFRWPTTYEYLYISNSLRGWESNTQPSACGENAFTQCATHGSTGDISNTKKIQIKIYFWSTRKTFKTLHKFYLQFRYVEIKDNIFSQAK